MTQYERAESSMVLLLERRERICVSLFKIMEVHVGDNDHVKKGCERI